MLSILPEAEKGQDCQDDDDQADDVDDLIHAYASTGSRGNPALELSHHNVRGEFRFPAKAYFRLCDA